jgi:broad specificity phosphatase PhoE
MIHFSPTEYAESAAPLPARLVLIRHAHTASNDDTENVRLSGWTDLPLTVQGHSQVRLLRDRFRNAPRFAAVYSSPLRRARDTAAALRGVSHRPLRIDSGLREIGCGRVDGMMLREIKRAWPELWQANLYQDDADFRWPGGESYREFRSRCTSSLDRIAALHPAQRVALVTHAGVIAQIVGTMTGTSPARWAEHRTGNTAITEVVWSNGVGKIVTLDDRLHLGFPLQHAS